jgi:1-phosphofructokinase family hexose kinase
MVLIVNPNFTTDRTISLDVLEPGHVYRTGGAVVTLGGKGVNVARVARSFGHRAAVVGFLPDQSVSTLMDLAGLEGLEMHGVPVAGAARATSVLVERSGRVTVLNEPGPRTDRTDWDALVADVAVLSPGHRSIACSGSVPPGSPPDAFARVVEVGRRRGMLVVVDTHGPALAGAVAAGPDVVSPNLAEAEALLFGAASELVEPTGTEVLARAGRAVAGLIALGARHAVVSAGRYGAVFDDDAGAVWCPSPEVHVVNPIGAGDSLVGGLIHALELGLGWRQAVRTATVVASLSCEQDLAGGVDVTRVAGVMSTLPACEIVTVAS